MFAHMKERKLKSQDPAGLSGLEQFPHSVADFSVGFSGFRRKFLGHAALAKHSPVNPMHQNKKGLESTSLVKKKKKKTNPISPLKIPLLF